MSVLANEISFFADGNGKRRFSFKFHLVRYIKFNSHGIPKSSLKKVFTTKERAEITKANDE